MGFFFNSRRTGTVVPTEAAGAGVWQGFTGTQTLKEWAENNIRIPRDVRDKEPNLPGGEGPGFLAEDFRVEIAADDQSTLVEIYYGDEDEPVGIGVARRRKGDRRNQELGTALATARAFQDASDRYAKVAEEMLR